MLAALGGANCIAKADLLRLLVGSHGYADFPPFVYLFVNDFLLVLKVEAAVLLKVLDGKPVAIEVDPDVGWSGARDIIDALFKQSNHVL